MNKKVITALLSLSLSGFALSQTPGELLDKSNKDRDVLIGKLETDNALLKERLQEIEETLSKTKKDKTEQVWKNLGTTPPAWALPYLERLNEYQIRVKPTDKVAWADLMDAAQNWFKPWPSDLNPLYCVGGLILDPARYDTDKQWKSLGRLQLTGTPLHDGGTKIVWTGGVIDGPVISTTFAHGPVVGSNFAQFWSGFQVNCDGRINGIEWGSANWGKLSNVFVRDPAKAGIRVLPGTNGAIIEGCHVFGRGQGLPPRKDSVGILFDSSAVATLVGNKLEQMNRGAWQSNNSSVTFTGTHFEACNTDIYSQNWDDRGFSHGTFTSFSNLTGELAVFNGKHNDSLLRGGVAQTKTPFYRHGTKLHSVAKWGPGYVPFTIRPTTEILPAGVTPAP